jgi:hypothetical protein
MNYLHACKQEMDASFRRDDIQEVGPKPYPSSGIELSHVFILNMIVI